MRAPHPGRDYPRTQRDFYDAFAREDDCWEWLDRLRWGTPAHKEPHCPVGATNQIVVPHFVCPVCGCPDAWLIKHGRRCKGCKHRTSALAGTPFHQTKIPLTHLLEAAWLMTEPSAALNAQGYQQLANTTHENAWAILHKYREVMYGAMSSLELHGLVEVDECFIGGKPRKRWQFTSSGIVTFSQAAKKHIVLVLVEKRRGGRVVFRRLNSTQAVDILPAVSCVVHHPSTIFTDAKPSYNHLCEDGYRHKVYNISQLPLPAHVYLPAVHSAAAHAQQWLSKAIIRTPDAKHMDYYLAEQAWRFNHRIARHRGLLFYRLMEATVNHVALTQKDVVGRSS